MTHIDFEFTPRGWEGRGTEAWEYFLGAYDNDHSIVVRIIRGNVYAQVFNHNQYHLPENVNDRPEDARQLIGALQTVFVGTYRAVFGKNYNEKSPETSYIAQADALEIRNKIFDYTKKKCMNVFSEK